MGGWGVKLRAALDYGFLFHYLFIYCRVSIHGYQVGVMVVSAVSDTHTMKHSYNEALSQGAAPVF